MSNKMKIPGFRIYCTEIELMENSLTEKEIVAVLHALKEYVGNGAEPQFKGAPLACFLFMKERVKEDMRAYRETCERNRNSILKRWANNRPTDRKTV